MRRAHQHHVDTIAESGVRGERNRLRVASEVIQERDDYSSNLSAGLEGEEMFREKLAIKARVNKELSCMRTTDQVKENIF